MAAPAGKVSVVGVLFGTKYRKDEDVTSAFEKTWIRIPEALNEEINDAAAEVAALRAEILSKVRTVVKGLEQKA